MPIDFSTNPAAQLTILLILVGLVGAVVPVVPGSLFVWLGILAWAIGERFQHINWIILVLLGILAVLGTFSEYWLRPLVQYRAGFGWKYMVVAILGGFGGGFLLSGIPIIGTIFGAVIGSLVATGGLAYLETRSVGEALRASQAYLVGCALSSLVEIVFSGIMLAVFVWRVMS